MQYVLLTAGYFYRVEGGGVGGGGGGGGGLTLH